MIWLYFLSSVEFILLTYRYLALNANARCLSRVRDRAFMCKRKILQRARKKGEFVSLN